jgi:hypothetical protein
MAKKRNLLGVLIGVLVFCFAGCTTFQASGLQMGLVIDGQKYETVGDFSEKEWTNKFLGWTNNGGTLFNITAGATDGQVKDAIEKNLEKYEGDGVINVKIKYGSNPIQWFLTYLTLGLWMPGTVTVSGTVVKAVE